MSELAPSQSITHWTFERHQWNQGRACVIGIDEVGRGPLAGPVVAAAVCFPRKGTTTMFDALFELNDSKRLTLAARERLIRPINHYCLGLGIGVVSSEEIDKLNILQATMRAMTIAVRELAIALAPKNCQPEFLLVDGNYFRTELKYPYQTIVGGDAKCASIAAASVVAKVYRDNLMQDYDKLYPHYGFSSNKGYGTRAHIAALQEYGPCDIHRRSFKTKALNPQVAESTSAQNTELIRA